jgi:hypothetical protein
MSLPIPPHRPVWVPGVHGYASAKTVRAGERIGFHVSSDRCYSIGVHRLGPDPDSRDSDPLVADLGLHDARTQPIHPGSYVHVDAGLPAGEALGGLTLEAWVMPWRCDGPRQGLLTQGDAAGTHSFGLFIDTDGHLAWQLGDGALSASAPLRSAKPLSSRRWQHVAATWDGREARLWIDGEPQACVEPEGAPRPACAPVRLGAAGGTAGAEAFADVDLAMAAIHACAVSSELLAARVRERAAVMPASNALLGCWPLRDGHGEVVADVGGRGWHGRVVNHGTWSILGPGLDAGAPDARRTDGETPASLHGLRLASDDLYDCRWLATAHLDVPADARAGLHVARLRFEWEGREAVYDITFLVRPRAGARPAPLLVLCAMSSWLAYAATPFARNQVDDPVWPRRSTGLENGHPEAPAFCSYTYHRAGQPSYFTGLRMPWPHASPAALYDPAGSGFAQWTRLERRLHGWLEREGWDFDVLADLDLHADPSILGHYRTVVVNGHSEYWSLPVVDAFDAWLRRGGNAIVLSGNTMYLRVSFDPAMTVMEQRKNDERGADPANAALRPPAGPHGEERHAQDGLRGGQLRTLGRSAASIIGLETAGWGFADAEDFGVYHVCEPAHPLFNQPHALGLIQGQTFGHAPGGGLPRAVGHEWDLSVATLLRMTKGSHEAGPLPEVPGGLTVIAQGRRAPGRMDTYLDWHSRVCEPIDGVSAEMIYWERPQGGRVFHAGAVGAAWVVGSDPVFEGLLRNVLHHFGCEHGAAAG